MASGAVEDNTLWKGNVAGLRIGLVCIVLDWSNLPEVLHTDVHAALVHSRVTVDLFAHFLYSK